MNDLITQNTNNVPAYLKDFVASNSLNEDVSSGIKGADYLPYLSIKGKCFSIRSNGNTQPLNTMSLDVVIIASRHGVSKVKYDNPYNSKGTGDTPVCASVDGVTPDYEPNLIDPATGAPCCNCKTCYFNQFGSSTKGAGKACKDFKRLIVMIASQDGKTFPKNAPALVLDVPATSLKSPKGTNLMMLRECVQALNQGNVPINAYVITLKFVLQSEYPQLVFEPKRWVMPEEMERIKALTGTDSLKNALEEKSTKPESKESEPEDTSSEETSAKVEPEEKVAPKRKRRTKEEVAETPSASVNTSTDTVEPDLFSMVTPSGQADAVHNETDEEKDADIMAKADAIFSQFKL